MARPVIMPGMLGKPPTPFRPETLGRSGPSATAALVAPTIRYVRKTGSDSNGGTSPSDAWLTVGKALTTVAANTWVYVGAGTYRETITVGITPSSEVRIIGDVDGFRTGDAGMVMVTAWTTSDRVAPSASAVIAMNGASNITFRNLVFVSGGAAITANTATQNIQFLGCAFFAATNGGSVMTMTGAYGMPLNWLVDQCLIWGYGSAAAIVVTLTTGPGGDYDTNMLIRNSTIWAGSGVQAVSVTNSGTQAGKGGGVRIRNCTVFCSGSNVLATTAAQVSTSVPCEVFNSHLWASGGTALSAGTSGQIVEDYNDIVASTLRTNVAVGGHSTSGGTMAMLFHFGQETVWGGMLRPFGEPMASSPLTAFGNDGRQTGYDLRGGPRPNGAAAQDIGAIQRGNNFGKETSTVHTGTNAISVTGDGFQDFDLAVNAVATTISAYCNYDSNYVGPPPRLMVLGNGELGISQVEINFTTAASGAYAQAAITINPTSAGIVTVRVISGDNSGLSKVAFDSLAVA